MCYNYSLIIYKNQREFEEIYGVDQTQKYSLASNFYVNSFSLPKMPVLTNKNPNLFQMHYWGLIPFWVKNNEDAEKIRNQTMNARAETIFEKPSFRSSIKQKRCLIPASGFFEWRYILGKNYPYYIYLENQKWFSFAGIWDTWKNPKTEENIYTYSIITCKSNNLLSKIHNKKKRMPVILPWKIQKKWLDNNLDENKIKSYLVPYPDNEMKAHTISRLITSKTMEKNISKVIEPFIYPELKDVE
jgi:putative SOS response-associated peptidase YedK